MKMRSLVLLCLLVAGCSSGPKLPPPKAQRPDEPPPPKTDLAHTSGLIIQSTPSAEVRVDGKPAGTTPLTVDGLPAGLHEVTFVDEDHGDVTMTVELSEGQYQRVHHNFPPRASEGIKK